MEQTLFTPDITPFMRRILIVEDEANQSLFLRSTLRKLPNCEVLTAASGEQALRLFNQQTFDLLITDYKLLGMDGMTLSQQVRAAHPRLPIIMITAFGNEELRAQAMLTSIERILDKPADINVIRAAALAALNKSKLAQPTGGGNL